jgi:hypothetical protein
MLIISNILGALSDGLCGVSGLAKTKRQIILINTVSNILGILCDLIIGGYTAVTTLVMSCIGELLNYKKERGKLYSTVYVIVLIIISTIFSTNGLIDALPVIANAEYIVVVSCTKETIHTKMALLVNTMLWCIFNISFRLYASAIIEIICIIIIFSKIVMYYKSKSYTENSELD